MFLFFVCILIFPSNQERINITWSKIFFYKKEKEKDSDFKKERLAIIIASCLWEFLLWSEFLNLFSVWKRRGQKGRKTVYELDVNKPLTSRLTKKGDLEVSKVLIFESFSQYFCFASVAYLESWVGKDIRVQSKMACLCLA